MSCLAPSEHYRACISITEMNRIERGISHRTRSNIVCFSALKHQSRPFLSVYELCIQVDGIIDGYNTFKTFIIRHIFNAASFFSVLKYKSEKGEQIYFLKGFWNMWKKSLSDFNQLESYYKISIVYKCRTIMLFSHSVFQFQSTFFLTLFNENKMPTAGTMHLQTQRSAIRVRVRIDLCPCLCSSSARVLALEMQMTVISMLRWEKVTNSVIYSLSNKWCLILHTVFSVDILVERWTTMLSLKNTSTFSKVFQVSIFLHRDKNIYRCI